MGAAEPGILVCLLAASVLAAVLSMWDLAMVSGSVTSPMAGEWSHRAIITHQTDWLFVFWYLGSLQCSPDDVIIIIITFIYFFKYPWVYSSQRLKAIKTVLLLSVGPDRPGTRRCRAKELH